MQGGTELKIKLLEERFESKFSK